MAARYQARLRYLLSWARPEARAAGSLESAVVDPEVVGELGGDSRSARWVWTNAASQVALEKVGWSVRTGTGPVVVSGRRLCSAAIPATCAVGPLESRRTASMASS